jgi:CheY-like chemotaxis protein
MSSNLVLVISENRQIGSEILLCLDSAGFEGRQCSLSQAVNDIERSTPILAIFDTALIDVGSENSFDDSLFSTLYNKNIMLILFAVKERDTNTILQRSGAREVVRTSNLAPELFKWLTRNKHLLFKIPPRPEELIPQPILAPPPRPEELMPQPVFTLPPRPASPAGPIAPPPRPVSAMVQSIAPPPRPVSAMVQSIAPPPRPGSAMGQSIAPPPRSALNMAQSIAPPPRPGSSMAQSIAPPPRPASAMAQSIAPPPRPATSMTKSIASPSLSESGGQQTLPQSSDSNILADTFSPVKKPLIRKMTGLVTVPPEALESAKKPLPPVVNSELLEIPEGTRELPPTIDITPPEPKSTVSQTDSSSRHILIIDKSPLIQHRLRQLAYTGLGWEWAPDITAGAILLKDEYPAAVFIQECLEELSGLQACSYIKNIPTYKDLPIFIIIEEDSSLSDEEILQYGANGSIREPFSSDGLIRFLAENNLILSLSENSSSMAHITDGLSLTISTSRSERSGVRKKNDERKKPSRNELPQFESMDLDLPDIADLEINDIHIDNLKIAVPDLLDDPLELPEIDTDDLSLSSEVDDLPDIIFPGLD